MASNPYVNKVQLADGTTVIDITGDTVAANKMLNGITAHDASGAAVTGSIQNGTITRNTSGGTSSGTIDRGYQIKVGAGYYPSDLYYTAEDNYGDLQIAENSDAETAINCDGYSTVSIFGINVPVPSSGDNHFFIKLPNGNGTVTFAFYVDSNGNVDIFEGQ